MDWVVEFRNKGGSSFRILPIWPNQYDPVAQIEERACSIDPKLVKAKSLPTFCRVDHTGKRIAKLSLEATINGVSARDIPLNDLVQRAAAGQSLLA